jgi:hypothetical protein
VEDNEKITWVYCYSTDGLSLNPDAADVHAFLASPADHDGWGELYRFDGRPFAGETALQLFRGRCPCQSASSPAPCWRSEDPLGLADSDLYRYVQVDPPVVVEGDSET